MWKEYRRLNAFAIAFAALLAGGRHAYGQALTITPAGKTVAAANSVPAVRPIVIAVQGKAPDKLCQRTVKPGALSFRYIVSTEVISPRRLLANEGTSAATSVPPVLVPGQNDRSFVMFNIVRDPSESTAEIDTCRTDLKAAKDKIKDAAKDVKTAEEKLQTAQRERAKLKTKIESLRADAATYRGSESATSEIASILVKIDTERTNLATTEDSLPKLEKEVTDAQKVLAEKSDEQEQELGASISETERLINVFAGGSLLKIGGISVGRFKAVFYDFSARDPLSTLQIMPLGSLPAVQYGDSVSGVLANVQPTTHPYTFYLAATAQDGVVINTDPVRPTFPVSGLEGTVRGSGPQVTDEVYVDVVLPVRGSYAPNQYPEVSISTERPSPDDPKKLVAVTLVDKAKYPQFRALYRYNFNTGVLFSGLRHHTYQKVRTIDDDPGTKDVDESRYRIDPLKGERSVKPAFALTYYLKPVDIQAPVGFGFLIPNPTIGFGFANPADNIYFGFSHEVLRNAQFFWGWHWGVVKMPVVRNAVSEDRDATAPLTRDGRGRAFSVGLTFNVAVISKIFK
jgi:hypothetical protein